MATITTLIKAGVIFEVLDTGKLYTLTSSYQRYCNLGVCSCAVPQLTEVIHTHSGLVKYHGMATEAPITDIAGGDEYYNTGDSKFYKYNGSSWIALN